MTCLGVADMRMEDPIPTFSYLVRQLKERFPDLAYLHAVSHETVLTKPPKDLAVSMPTMGEPAARGALLTCWPPLQTADFIQKIWKPLPFITTGAYTREKGLEIAETTGALIGYGVLFLANVSRDQPDNQWSILTYLYI